MYDDGGYLGVVIIGFWSFMDGFKDVVEFENSFNNVR